MACWWETNISQSLHYLSALAGFCIHEITISHHIFLNHQWTIFYTEISSAITSSINIIHRLNIRPNRLFPKMETTTHRNHFDREIVAGNMKWKLKFFAQESAPRVDLKISLAQCHIVVIDHCPAHCHLSQKNCRQSSEEFHFLFTQRWSGSLNLIAIRSWMIVCVVFYITTLVLGSLNSVGSVFGVRTNLVGGPPSSWLVPAKSVVTIPILYLSFLQATTHYWLTTINSSKVYTIVFKICCWLFILNLYLFLSCVVGILLVFGGVLSQTVVFLSSGISWPQPVTKHTHRHTCTAWDFEQNDFFVKREYFWGGW